MESSSRVSVVTASIAVAVVIVGLLGSPAASAWNGPFSLGQYTDFSNPGVMTDGSLLQVDETDDGDQLIVRLMPDGRRRGVAGARGKDDSSGDGGAATEAGLYLPTSTFGMPDGGFLLTDGDLVRRVDPAGVISTLATVPDLLQVARLPDGTVVAASSAERIYGVGAAGTKRLIWRFPRGTDFDGIVSAAADGSLIAQVDAQRLLRRDPQGKVTLLATLQAGGTADSWVFSFASAPDGGYVASARNPSRIVRVAPDGRVSVLVPPAAFRSLGRRRGDGYPDGLVVMTDGTLIVSSSLGLLMFPAAEPAFPAVAVRRAQRFAAGVRATVESTHAGTLVLHVRRRGKPVAARTARVASGTTAISLPRLRRGVYNLRLSVTGKRTHARLSSHLRVTRHSIMAYL